MDSGMIYAKTPKGQEEMEKRTDGLNLRSRRVLILIDGKRSVGEIRNTNADEQLLNTLSTLEAGGYIKIAEAGTEAPPVSALGTTTFRDISNEQEPMNLAKARNFMTNTLKTFVGAVGTSSLLDRIEKCPTHEALRGLFDEWYQAIVSSRDGKREADGLRVKLLEVI